MGVDTAVWCLKEYVSEIHGIASAVQLRSFIEARLGVIVTVQTLRTLMRSEPPAPRREMIQLLCDAFDCSSDAFYVLHPNPARAQEWAKEKSGGKRPSALYQPKVAEPVDEIVEPQDEIVLGKLLGKCTSLQATFTDPRTLFKKTVKSKEQRI
jgi:hypothetical protein